MKKKTYLKFINYDFIQDDNIYKVNSDTSILGMFLDPLNSKTVLDIGTNTGALLLYALDKKAKHLIGVDINKDALDLAKENISNYTKDFKLYHKDVRELDIDEVDVIICNPPYFEMNNVTKDLKLRDAMFEESLPLNDLFDTYRRLLKNNGEVYMIYPTDRFPELYECIKDHKMKIMKMRFIHDKNSLYALRVLVKLKIGKMTKVRILSPIIIEDGEYHI